MAAATSTNTTISTYLLIYVFINVSFSLSLYIYIYICALQNNGNLWQTNGKTMKIMKTTKENILKMQLKSIRKTLKTNENY